MLTSLLFTKIIATWSLPDESVEQLHFTFPWLPKENDGRLMTLERQNVEAGLECIRDEVKMTPSWVEERGRCYIDVTIIPKTRMA